MLDRYLSFKALSRKWFTNRLILSGINHLRGVMAIAAFSVFFFFSFNVLKFTSKTLLIKIFPLQM